MNALRGYRREPGNLAYLGIALTVVCAIAVGVNACDDEVTPPQVIPGSVVITLESPYAEGAVVLETTDEGVIDVGLVDVTMAAGIPVVSIADGEAFHSRTGGISRIVAYRDRAGEINIEVSVEDVNAPQVWQIVEVADGDNELRTSLSGYEITTMVYRPDPPQGDGS